MLDPYNNLGIALKNCGEFLKAMDIYQKALKLNSNHHLINFNLGDLYEKFNEIEKAKNSSDELKKCRDSSKEGIKKINDNIHSKAFKNNQCTAWLIGWDESNISKEYERRKSE